MEVPDDLIDLNPPTTENLLRVIHRRFKRDIFHTRLGPRHLLAVNPYRLLRKSTDSSPSLEEFLQQMTKRLVEGRETKQLFLPLGESGSGKSQAVLQGLHTLAAQRPRLLAAVNLLRILGNSRTQGNEDASKFVLLVDLQLDFRGQVVASAIHTYMLEKEVVTSRIGANFHVFYGLLAGADPQLLKSLRLSRSSDFYGILSPLPSPTNAQTGRETFEQIRSSLCLHDLDERAFFQVLAFILKMGNVFFIPVTRMDGTAGIQLEPRIEFQEAGDLLGIDLISLETALLYDNCGVVRDPVGAGTLRDSLLRTLYARLFLFLTSQVSPAEKNWSCSLSLLDFPGFQSVEKNCFQQLLLNLIGEKVQEVLVDGELKERQEEWIREGFKWVKVDTRSNPPSVLTLLEQNGPLCSSSRSDEEILDMILDGSPAASRLGPDQFRIKHFAGTLTYSRRNFPEKTDALPKLVIAAMFSASHKWIPQFFPEGGSGHLGGRPLTSLAHLQVLSHKLRSLASASLYTIHCIKANELKVGGVFEGALVLHQLKYHRIMDILIVTRDGFEMSRDYERFLGRYRLLSLRTWPRWDSSPREGVLVILNDLLVPMELFFLGRTRILLKASLVSDLESFRRERLDDLALLIQKTWRGWRAFRKLQRMRESQRMIAKFWRNYHKRRLDFAEAEGSRRRVAVGKIQRAYLHWKRKSFLRELMAGDLVMSPIVWDWPRPPRCLWRGSQEMQRLFHKWRCSVYRSHYKDPTQQNRMGEKVTASNLLKGKKASYPKSVSHPFLGDYVRLRVNSEWRKIAKQDATLVFADLVHKLSPSSGKMTPYLLAVSTFSLMVLDSRTLTLKQRIPVQEITRLSLSPYADPFIVFHRIRHENMEEGDKATEPCTGCTLFEESAGKRGDLILSTQHLVELVTKVYLIVKNLVGGKGPTVHIGERFDVSVGNGSLQLHFVKRSAGDGSEVLKVGVKQGHVSIFL